MTTFRHQETEGPGTHVFIIGVGDYPYLKDGSGRTSPDHREMGQLTSPPVSAMAMLNWVDTTLYNPDAPLKSIEVLISQVGQAEYTDADGLSQQIDPATWGNYEASVQAWKTRASSDPKNVAIFYFCGHGLGNGVNTYLLTEDAGHTANLLRDAFQVNALRLSMRDCRALNQLYLIDACRTLDLAVVLDPNDISQSGLQRPTVLTVFKGTNPVLYAAQMDKQAYGAPGQVSIFTAALLDGLNRCAVFRVNNQRWAVAPLQLQQAIAAIMDESTDGPACPADGLSGIGFPIHVLKTVPEVLIHVRLNNEDVHHSAEISYTSTSLRKVRPDLSHPWRTFVPHGQCSVAALFQPETKLTSEPQDIFLVPPFQNITLEVV
ncbi:caspase family protein [Pseudomonas sp. EA_65y_Pfl2_P78]|uniref:caspase family protein n=1 Tax=Pseudomonas sp. EA_65y_Pfl2_P78 TaxID=3088695 RepID=UPI0030DBD222